jgi:hypothetical protein
MKRSLFLILVFLFFSYSTPIFADSSYVLPYPSVMPGGFSYKLHLVQEELLKYWYFGSLGQFEYNRKLADKYLVEAKTLFEYKQYLLADNALKKSDKYFQKASQALVVASREKKNVSEKQQLFKQEALKHMEVLAKIKSDIPAIFNWSPEKTSATQLTLHQDIEQSANQRSACL